MILRQEPKNKKLFVRANIHLSNYLRDRGFEPEFMSKGFFWFKLTNELTSTMEDYNEKN